jgi:hypothetical protein|tara:strand:+ start:234 stop:410 length:177 start_codon:yes stop_codon:yes gene_type:complete
MPILSEEQLLDLAQAYSCEQIIELLDLEPMSLLLAFKTKVEDNLEEFNLRPVDTLYDF